MSIKLFIAALVLLSGTLSQGLYAQDSSATHTMYLDLGGSAGAYSINYQEHLIGNAWWEFQWSVGLSCFPIDKNNGIVLVIPTLLHLDIGQDPSKLEFGFGQALSVTTKGSGFSMLTPFVGYRYHNPQSRWMYRVTYTPIVSYLLQFQYQHWMGLSVGYVW